MEGVGEQAGGLLGWSSFLRHPPKRAGRGMCPGSVLGLQIITTQRVVNI